MKKLCFVLVFHVFLWGLAFGETSVPDPAGPANKQEEVDYLLFFPNSSNRFVNEEQAKIQLDYLAAYLLERNLNPGQIFVYGYAADAVNDIEPIDLSRNRALFVINELQKRGLPKNLFSDPIGYGSVNLWGGNSNEKDRIPNRRVRILLDGDFLTPEIIMPAPPVVIVEEKPATQELVTAEGGSAFPWWLLLLLLLLALLAAIILLAAKRRKNSAIQSAPEPATGSKPEIVSELPAYAAISYTTVNLEEEIRWRAYELYLERGGQNGDADGDWYMAVSQICARYEARGYETYAEEGSWWAKKSYS